MEIHDILSGLAQSQLEIAQDYCIINGSMMPLANIEKMGYEEFSQRSKIVMPTKLYKYYPNIWTTEQYCKKPINYSL